MEYVVSYYDIRDMIVFNTVTFLDIDQLVDFIDAELIPYGYRLCPLGSSPLGVESWVKDNIMICINEVE